MFQTLQRIVLLNLLSFYLIYMASSQFCNEDTLADCAKQIIHDPINNLSLINVNETYLITFCGKYKSFSYCYSQIRKNCFGLDSLLASYDGIDGAFNYLCVTNKEEYLQQLNCYKDSVVLSLAKSCRDNLKIVLDSVKNSDPKGKIIYNCKFINIFFECLQNMFRSLCTASALNWAITYEKYLVGPQMRFYECPGWVNQSNNQLDTTVLIVVIILSLIAFLALLIACILLITKTSFFRKCISKYKTQKKDVTISSPTPPEIPDPPLPSYEGLVRLQKMWKQLSSSPDEESQPNTISISTAHTHPLNYLTTASESNSEFFPSPMYNNTTRVEETPPSQSASSTFTNSERSFRKNCIFNQKKSKNKQEKSSKKLEDNSRTTSSVFTTDASGETGSGRRSSGFKTYRGSSELSVYAHVHQYSDFEKNVSRT